MFFNKILDSLKLENLSNKNSDDSKATPHINKPIIEVPKMKHEHIAGKAIKENEIEPTCTNKGSYDEVIYCTDNVCQKELSRNTVTVPALGHIAEEPVIENRVEPQKSKPGSYEKVVYCKRCNKELNRKKIMIPALPKTPIENLKEKLNTDINNDISDFSINGRDTYFIDAAKLIVENEKGTIGMLQRNFKLGFNRAARIMDQLEEAGIVGPEEGTKPRCVLMTLEQLEEYEQHLDEAPVPKPPNINNANNTLSEEGALLMHLNILADFSNDGTHLSNIDHAIIYNCTEKEQHRIINHLLTYNSSKTIQLIVFDEDTFSYANYNSLSQMLTPVVSDSFEILTIIKSLKDETTYRLHEFAKFQSKDLVSYNSKATDTLPTVIFIISELYLVKTYFEDSNDVIQLLLNAKKAGIYLLMFSQFDIKRFSLGVMQDLIKIYNPQQAYHMVCPAQTDESPTTKPKSISAIDNMSGQQFEDYCADLLLKNGFFNIRITQGSGDHGTDILAEKDDISYAIQCKCYSSNIGNTAVQQAHSGKGFYHKDIAVVLTNQYFTTQAKEEADTLGVKLWDRSKLEELIGKANNN